MVQFMIKTRLINLLQYHQKKFLSQNFLEAIKAPLSNLAYLLNAIKDKKEAESAE